MPTPDSADQPVLRVIIGSTRPTRIGPAIAAWVAETARASGRFDVRVTDLVELGLPMFDEPEHPHLGRYANAHTLAWSDEIRASDAFILVFPEYNNGYPGSLKNAIDFLSGEWAYKPVSMVSYGGLSGGVRAATTLLPVLTALKMLTIAGSVPIHHVSSLMEGEGAGRVFHPEERHQQSLERVIAELARLTPLAAALRP